MHWRARVSLAIMFGVVLAAGLAGEIASARWDAASQPLSDGLQPATADAQPILPLTYAYVITGNVPVYASPVDEALGVPPLRSLGTGYLWVSLAETRPVYQDGHAWLLINANEYVRADQLAVYSPSSYQGATLAEHPSQPLAWLVYTVRASARPGEEPTKESPLFKRYALVTIYEEQMVGDWTWYRVGDNQWIEQRNLGVVRPIARPEGVGANEKWIDVHLYEQTLAAYEGDRMVYATLVSTGLPWWPTEPGLFRVWTKVKMAKMSGRDGYSDYYYLEDVPWTMYFNGPIAFHTAYWHDRFGFPHSHGCVNLAPKDAQWLFEWTTPKPGLYNWTMPTDNDPGTWVWVHE